MLKDAERIPQRGLMPGVLRIGVYPVVMGVALFLLWQMLRWDVPLSWAPYVALLFTAPLVIVAERYLPHRVQWQPTREDFIQDSFYMILVQTLLPLCLAWISIYAAQHYLSSAGLLLALWPVGWPIWAQLFLKIAAGDFFRYWLHRAAHTWTPLWRLHAVHHASAKLYTTNVFRFHPAEKILQFFCDSLPFILLGIPPEVLAYYFVFYAMSGLFQHCNCDVRLGWLNYVVSGPEVHRWHHSRLVAESNTNYAHSFVFWDILFGTYYRPKLAQVTQLGLLDDNYPSRFSSQMLAPFSADRRNNAS